MKTLRFEWERFLKWGQFIRLGDVSPETISKYKTYLLGQGYEKSTARSSLLCIPAAFRVAIKELHCMQGPNPVKFLDLEEIDRLLLEAEKHGLDMHKLVALGIYTGMRKNELINARWEWSDWNNDGIVLARIKKAGV